MIEINTADFNVLSNKLEKIGKADLPVAVRSTLNSMAFKMKGAGSKRGQIDIQAEKDFDYRRNKTLFKVMTGVQKASGLTINRMQSKAGIVSRSGRTELAEGLAQQQKGGKLKKKATPTLKTRPGSNISKRVRRPSYLRNLNSIDATNKRGQKFIQAAIRAKKEKRTLLIKTKSGDTVVAKVRSIKRARGRIDVRISWLYRYNQNNSITLGKSRPFINTAAKTVIVMMPKEFEKQARKRISKSLSK